MELQQLISKIKKLKIDKAHGIAPHKPIMLISLLQYFDNGCLNENKIYITPELVALFKSNWSQLVTTKHDCRFALPFYHLTSDGFWQLIPKQGFENILQIKGSMRSFNQLNAAVDYATLQTEVYQLLSQKINRDVLIQVLLDIYFEETKTNYSNSSGNLFSHYEQRILNEDPIEYIKEIKQLKATLNTENYEEEIYLRGGAFKREIPKIYNNTCCISGLRIDATINMSMIDACHIIPFAESYNDTITNGIALCPNLHRAFDRGLIGIDENYKVVISKAFKENESNYSITQFKGKLISLPFPTNLHPNTLNLKWHITNKFNN